MTAGHTSIASATFLISVLGTTAWATPPPNPEQAADADAPRAAADAGGGQVKGAAEGRASPAAPSTLEELLERVRAGYQTRDAARAKRESTFLKAKQDRARLLSEAQDSLAQAEQESTTLEATFSDNERRIADLEETLRLRLGTMGELFGVVRQVAGDARANVQRSLVSAEHRGREAALDALARSKELPTVEQLEGLWFTLQQEMVESGRVSRFNAVVAAANGSESEREVVRVGAFNAVAGGKYLRWLPEVETLSELPRQPASRYVSTVANLEAATDGPVRFALDPSRGSILSLLVNTPSVRERIELGGLIGFVIMGLGGVAVLIALWRLLQLLWERRRIRRQQRSPIARPDNALGRVMEVYAQSPNLPPSALEMKLDEAIVREQGRLSRFLWAVKVVSVVAPLLGLLGTVTGMIRTFQAITLFGTGDAKLMAGGISEALVTTMLGLVVAIPLVLLHSWLRSITQDLMEVLGSQSAGIVATVAEEEVRHESAA